MFYLQVKSGKRYSGPRSGALSSRLRPPRSGRNRNGGACHGMTFVDRMRLAATFSHADPR
jgi:hypothetical protein